MVEIRKSSKKSSKKLSKKSSKKSLKKSSKKWSQIVTEKSNSLNLEPGIFTKKSPKQIAESIFNSAKLSTKRKAVTVYQSAVMMINFYINRAGKNLSKYQKNILEKAKEYLKIHRTKLENTLL